MRFSVKLYKDHRYGYWYICVNRGGQRERWSTGIKGKGKNPPEAAEAIRRRVEIALAEGKSLAGVDVTLGPFLDNYLAYCETGKRNAPKTLIEKRRYKKTLLAYFGDVPLDTIDRASIEDYIRDRGAGAPTINRELAMLKHAFNYALDQGIVDRNPAARLPRLREPRRDIRILTEMELRRWFSWCRRHDPLLYDLSVIALNTGLRPGDILKIRGEDVNIEKGLLKAVMSKTGGTNYLPLNDAAAEVLGRRKRNGYIFPGRNPDEHLTYSPFYARFLATKRVTAIDFRFYDFRHNAAVRLLEAGADIVTVSDILGHSDIRVTREYYLKIVDRRKRAALQRLVTKVARVLPDIPEDLSPQDFEDVNDGE